MPKHTHPKLHPQPSFSLPFIFRLHRLFFGVSSAFPKECLLNFFAFYFGGIRVDFSRFALYFGGISVDFSL
jgi:hypothetical protein